jgi:putative ABC transport system permease protein
MQMHGFRQALALTVTAVRSIPQRLGASLVTVIGVVTVMAVLVTMLALGEGLERLAQTGSRPDRVTVISAGAQSSLASSVSRATLDKVLDKPGIRRDAQGKPLVAGVVLMIIDGVTRTNHHGAIGFFAAGPQWRQIWPDVQVVEGRYFDPGLHELLVSQRIRDRFKGMDRGDTVKARGTDWKIVGVYKDTGGFFDNSLVADADTVIAAFPQTTYSMLSVILRSPGDFNSFKKSVTGDPTLAANVQTEDEANESVIKGLRGVLDFISYFIASLMGIGAACGALSSLYAAVDSRTREIATLRAIGFGSGAVVTSVLAEGMLLAIPAALLGAAIAWFLFNGHVVVASGLSFHMTVTPHLVVVGLCWAIAIAAIGGLLPAIRAAGLPVAMALRAS